MPTEAPVLEVQDLSLRFKGAPANIVDGLSFAVRPGETLCIVGESGCGKSVTALSLMGLLPRAAPTRLALSLRKSAGHQTQM